jgi:hypothetical protein
VGDAKSAGVLGIVLCDAIGCVSVAQESSDLLGLSPTDPGQLGILAAALR